MIDTNLPSTKDNSALNFFSILILRRKRSDLLVAALSTRPCGTSKAGDDAIAAETPSKADQKRRPDDRTMTAMCKGKRGISKTIYTSENQSVYRKKIQ
jgi:hypothetical protein